MDSSVRKCGCEWEECEQFASELKLYASIDDCWTKDLVRERFYGKTLDKCPQKSIAHHNSLKRCVNVSGYLKNVFLRPHHYPRALWLWRENHSSVRFHTPLSKNNVKNLMDMDGGLSRFGDYTNSVFAYNKMNAKDVSNNKYKHQFVQAPLTTRIEVKEYIQCLQRTRKERVTISTSPSIPSPPSILKKVMEIDVVQTPVIFPRKRNISFSTDSTMNSQTSGTTTLTVPTKSPVTYIVPSYYDLQDRLRILFQNSNCDVTALRREHNAIEIIRLIIFHHERREPFLLSKENENWLFPCGNSTSPPNNIR